MICWAGSAGLVLARLLGQQELDVILIERLPETVAEPRVIAIDAESLRTLQHLGMQKGFESELLQGMTAVYASGVGEDLFCVGSPELKPYRYSLVNSFDQPTLDRYLAKGLETRRSVQVRFNTALESFVQDAGGVRIICRNSAGERAEIRADCLIGADGGVSTIRSLLNIKIKEESNPLPWLVIDTVDPVLDGQLDWEFFCDPARPGMTMRKKHGKRRWEWMLIPVEDREDLLKQENIHRLISPYTDVSRVDIYRKRVYDFHAIIAERWWEGRVFLAGEAAHMTPPIAGQGLNSGFRDEANFSWKLSDVIKNHANPAILVSYELERRDRAGQLPETALNLGKQIQPTDPEEAPDRDAFFAEINKDPAAVRSFGDRISASINNDRVAGDLVIGEVEAGAADSMLLQPRVKSSGGEERLMDEFLGDGFALLGIDCDPVDAVDDDTLNRWLSVGASVTRPDPSSSRKESGWLIEVEELLRDWVGQQSPHNPKKPARSYHAAYPSCSSLLERYLPPGNQIQLFNYSGR